MDLSKKLSEKDLHLIWKNQDFTDELISLTNDKISVINAGEYNDSEAGPDFKHARIQIGSITFVGDVEIDLDYRDWKNHGHNINNHYNKVILHVTLYNSQRQNYVYTCDGRKVLSIPLLNFIAADNLKDDIKLAGKKNRHSNINLKCSTESDFISEEVKRKFILKLGVERFQNKCNKILRRLKELKFISDLKLNEPVIRYEMSKEFENRDFKKDDFSDRSIWEQLLFEMIFEALGYSKNKTIMKNLAQNVPIDFLAKVSGDAKSITALESVLFNIAGLMPEIIDENEDEYILNLQKHWNKYSNLYDGKKFDETRWQFLGQRPQNFPTIRIVGGAKIVDDIISNNLISKIIKKIREIHSLKVLISSVRSLFIVKSQGYWQEHYVFQKKANVKLNYLIGVHRADEIFINVLIPFFSVYFKIFEKPDLVKKVLKIYNIYEQKLDNKIIRNVTAGLNLNSLNKKSIYSQGMIELYRNYCTKNKCLECEIGEQIFK